MIKHCILIFATLTINFSYSQITIEVEKSNGLFLIPCKVNGIPMKFIFDTGATDVTLSATEALFLIKNGLIENEDIIGSNKYQTASGDILTGTKLNIKKIQIENLILENVSATIVHDLQAPLLLGQNVLSKLGKVTLDNNQLTIENISNNSAQEAISESCNFSRVVPFKIGMNKFDLSLIDAKDNNINTIPKFDDLNIYERQTVENAIKNLNCGWEKFPYLSDKVFRCTLNYYNSNYSCLNVEEFHYRLTLADDHLYKIVVLAEYDNIEKILDVYNSLLAGVPDEYEYESISSISNSNTNEKIGEGTTFYKLSREKRNKTKSDYLSITYTINFESTYDAVEEKYKSSTKIKNYELAIEMVNLMNTKLTNQGY